LEFDAMEPSMELIFTTTALEAPKGPEEFLAAAVFRIGTNT
jgi:hypothetical protein